MDMNQFIDFCREGNPIKYGCSRSTCKSNKNDYPSFVEPR